MKTNFKTIWAGRVFGLAVVVALATAASCASTQALTQGEVGRSGARQFSAPKDTMFAVCVGALTAEGYQIASSDPATGVIVTQAQAVHTPDKATSRAYRVTVTSDGRGSRVVAQPILYSGARDISSSDVWVLDGPEGERAQWSELFGVMDAALLAPAREAVATDGAASPSLGKEQAAPASEKTTPADDRKAGGLRAAGLSAPQGASSSDAARP